MPALNEGRTIVSAVESVLRQRGVDVEILVADGRSTDGTRAAVSALADADPRVRLLENPSRIIPSGLNVALAAARGEFIARVDCHATVSPDYLARAVEHLRRDPRLAGVGGLRRGVSDCPSGRAVALALSSRFGVGNSLNHYGDRYRNTDHASFGVYRAELARRVGGWDESLPVNEDVDFDHRLRAAGATLAYDPEMVIYWKVRRDPRELFAQYRRYGRGKAAMVRKNGPAAVRARHLVPPAVVVGVGVLVPAALWSPRALLGAAPYAAGVAVASRRAWRRRPVAETVSATSIPASFVAMHFGWGLGFLEGLTLGRSPAMASGAAGGGPS